VKIIGYITVGSVVIIASLFCLLSSTCALSSNTTGDRAVFGFLALVALGVAVGGVMLIAKISREE
jgi:ABC-type Na+ efflux pump permease subunit